MMPQTRLEDAGSGGKTLGKTRRSMKQASVDMQISPNRQCAGSPASALGALLVNGSSVAVLLAEQNFRYGPRIDRVFCSSECRYSPLGLAMIGAKGGDTRSVVVPFLRRTVRKLRVTLRIAASKARRQASERQQESLRVRCLKAARLLQDAGYHISVAGLGGIAGDRPRTRSGTRPANRLP